MDEQKRRRLSDAEIEEVKKQILDSIYADIGKSIVKKFLWVAGACMLAVFAYLKGTGKISG